MTQITGSFDVPQGSGKNEGIPMAFHFQRQLDDMRISNQDRFEAGERAISAAFGTAQEALAQALVNHNALHTESDRRYAERYQAQQEALEVALHGHDSLNRERFDEANNQLAEVRRTHDTIHVQEELRIQDGFTAAAAARESARQRVSDQFASHLDTHVLNSRAIDKAEAAVGTQLSNMNDFRGQLREQSTTFMPRSEVRALFEGLQQAQHAAMGALGEKIADATKRLDLLAGRDDGSSRAKLAQNTVIGMAIALIGVILTAIVVIISTGT